MHIHLKIGEDVLVIVHHVIQRDVASLGKTLTLPPRIDKAAPINVEEGYVVRGLEI
jgi:hypothetical protein